MNLEHLWRRGETPHPDWTQAACRGCDPNLFHPERGEDTSAAKAVCQDCPISEGCLEYAVAAGERIGIWGGLSEQERRRIRRARRREVA